jgi:hypothetical protein
MASYMSAACILAPKRHFVITNNHFLLFSSTFSELISVIRILALKIHFVSAEKNTISNYSHFTAVKHVAEIQLIVLLKEFLSFTMGRKGCAITNEISTTFKLAYQS